MAGFGRIIGGSCTIEFTVKDNQGTLVSTAKTEDTNAGKPVTVTTTFPDGTSRDDTLRRGQEIRFKW